MPVLALIGSSGSGKDSVAGELRKKYDLGIIPSNTTRGPRPNEDPATSYYRFRKTVEEMDRWKAEGDEAWREPFAGETYVTRLSEMRPAFDSASLSLIILVPSVILRFQAVMQAHGQDFQLVFLHPKPEGERIALMHARGDSVESILKRSGEAGKFWDAMRATGVGFTQAWNFTTIADLVRQVEATITVRWPGLLPIQLY